jgi:hypothetical protein
MLKGRIQPYWFSEEAMTYTDAAIKNDDHDEWAERGDYWLQQVNPALSYNDRKRRNLHLPLILSGHGVRLKVDRGTLLIQCGYTHYPQKPESYRYFPRDKRLPSRIVVLDGDGSVTFDALEWLAAQGVALIQLDWRGEVVSVGGANYAADPELVRQQLEIQHSLKLFEFAKWLIHSKVKKTHAVIERISDHSPAKELALKQLREPLKITIFRRHFLHNHFFSGFLGFEQV